MEFDFLNIDFLNTDFLDGSHFESGARKTKVQHLLWIFVGTLVSQREVYKQTSSLNIRKI
jgi:hypothetical protein